MVKRTPSLAQPQKTSLPVLKNSNPPPRKRRSSSLPPPLSNLESLPTFTGSIFSAVGKTTSTPKPKPSINPTTRALKIANRSNSILGARVARAERIGGDVRLSRDILEKMSDLDWRIHMENRFATIIALMNVVDERKTIAIAKQTSIEAKRDKIFRSSLLQREVDRSFLSWVLTVQDPRAVWIPPFRSGSLWKTYMEKEIRSGNFSLSSRVQHDWEKTWVVCRDRRDALDQKKVKFANAAAKSYSTAIQAIEHECVLIYSKQLDPELAFKDYSQRVVKGTGFQETITVWLQTYSIEVNARGLEALGGILEHVLSKRHESIRNDFARVWRSAKELGQTTQSQDAIATQPLGIMDWSM